MTRLKVTIHTFLILVLAEVSRQLHAPAALSIIQRVEGWVRTGKSRRSSVVLSEASPFLAYYTFGHIK
jgi:hypothetical protein